MRFLLAGLLVLGATACKDALDVQNTDQPDQTRALARPSDVENLIGSSYLAVQYATLGGLAVSGAGANDAIQPQTLVMGLENFSNLANFGMSLRSAIPRAGIDNSRNNAAAAGNYRDFLGLHRAARQAAVGLDRVNDPNFTFFPASAAQKIRARAMAHFVIGTALGNVALIYDQGSPVSPTDPTTTVALRFMPYDSLMLYALSELDSAYNLAGSAITAGTAGWFPTPTAWFGASTQGGLALSVAQFQGLCHGYKARFMAGVARTPAQRAAAAWPTIIQYATDFTTAFPNDFAPVMDGQSTNWDVVWPIQHFASNQTNWDMGVMFMLGMSDTTGAYLTWLNASNAAKAPFLVVGPDKRIAQGATRAAQQAASPAAPVQDASAVTNPTGANWITYPYYRNRSVPDWTGDPWANSWYDHYRFRAFFNASRIGRYPVMTTAEISMLAAEGYIRASNFDAAVALINTLRVNRGNLPAFAAAGNTAATVAPGTAAGCVPKTPTLTGSAYSVACASIFEAMKYEKRMEMAYTGPYMWFVDGRGWGDLPAGTALMWPTPYQEIDTRQTGANPPAYVAGYGGPGGANAATVGTYGLQ